MLTSKDAHIRFWKDGYGISHNDNPILVLDFRDRYKFPFSVLFIYFLVIVGFKTDLTTFHNTQEN